MKEIKLTQGFVTQVDDEDYELLNKFKWSVVYNKSKKMHSKYVSRHLGAEFKYRTAYLHRLIMNCPKGLEIDHIDCDGLNNQKNNLRICTHKENLSNVKKRENLSSAYKGVCLGHRHYK